MDPDVNLQEQEALLSARYMPSGDDAQLREYVEKARRAHERLWELRDALADWLRGGGFEPDWSKAPRASHYYGKDR